MMQANKGERVPMKQLAAQLYKDAGIAGFYRGVQANCLRACVLNGTKMACYDVSKGYVTRFTGWTRKDARTVFLSSVFAGFVMTCTVAPFDMVRTALMNQPTNQKMYSGFVDAVVKIARQHGPMAFVRLRCCCCCCCCCGSRVCCRGAPSVPWLPSHLGPVCAVCHPPAAHLRVLAHHERLQRAVNVDFFYRVLIHSSRFD